MATHAPITGAPARASFMPVPMPLRLRRAIRAEIETHLSRVDLLIARLDRADAPLDDVEDDDPAGGSVDDVGEHSSDDGAELLLTLPIYALDQTRGPTNEGPACREWRQRRLTG